MTRVKICGCRSVEQALAAAEAGADFVGLMFAQSRRRIDPEEASEIVRALGTPLADLEMALPPASYPPAGTDLRSWFEHGASALERLLQRKRPLTVGVFANNDPDEINEIVDECGIDLIQLSGGEPWSHCLLANRQVVKVVHVAADDSTASVTARLESGSAAAVLLDRAGDSVLGGTGQVFDWEVASGVAQGLPLWLAGGLTPDNVAQAITTVRPWCVDVSSGVETDGVKDVAKIQAFLRAVKGQP
ncbi:MAG TPA: phosphoribosylanthranilate isomerase [Dehalococcoidia bacterium]|nr:phosphoribosylanthranilate isomerase [Dehalococcoidia bacterium]